MKTIQWFPGHMAKARRQVTEKLKFIDVVFELVDARIPVSSRNPMMDEIIMNKPRVLILNKADLADPVMNVQWKNYYEAKGIPTVIMNAHQGEGIKTLTDAAKRATKEKFDKLRAKGVVTPRAIRALILGIPNVGKSTLINRLARKNIAKTGDRPGVTTAQQWVKVGKELELLDTPGILWPKFEDERIGMHLAITGAIKDTILPLQDIGFYTIQWLKENYRTSFFERYGFPDTMEDSLAFMEYLAKKQNFVSQENIDYDRTAEFLLRDIRSGRLGRMTLDVFDQ
ncbi:MAG TPA: ribosome biogenesis GTPase YlqF [Firmicutes bacterium]|nr:ribosome biogenesis GTPase YlqF [Bacillales bacterium]HJA40920.1 ribosome biogenesis GTPase YlqF [Bacillota bacterium]